MMYVEQAMPIPLLCTLKGNFDVKWFKQTKYYTHTASMEWFFSSPHAHVYQINVVLMRCDMIYVCVYILNVCVICVSDAIRIAYA